MGNTTHRRMLESSRSSGSAMIYCSGADESNLQKNEIFILFIKIDTNKDEAFGSLKNDF